MRQGNKILACNLRAASIKREENRKYFFLSFLGLVSCAVPAESGVRARSAQHVSASVSPRREETDFLRDSVRGGHQIYTGYMQISGRWIFGRISRINGVLYWFNEEDAVKDSLWERLNELEANYMGGGRDI